MLFIVPFVFNVIAEWSWIFFWILIDQVWEIIILIPSWINFSTLLSYYVLCSGNNETCSLHTVIILRTVTSWVLYLHVCNRLTNRFWDATRSCLGIEFLSKCLLPQMVRDSFLVRTIRVNESRIDNWEQNKIIRMWWMVLGVHFGT